MMRSVVVSRRAHHDIESAIDYYVGEDAIDAALGLVDAIEDARHLLSRHPHIGSTRFAGELGIPELRSLALPRYPYIVFYTDDGGVVRIHRVLHTRRDLPAEFSD